MRKDSKKVRGRYINHLNPDLCREEWTKEEDAVILEMFLMKGKKWADMSKTMKGRSVMKEFCLKNYNKQENMIKNRFYSHI